MSLLGNNTTRIVNADATAATSSASSYLQLGPKEGGVLVVTASSALASFQLEGRIDPSSGWVLLHTANTTLSGGAGTALQPIANMLSEIRLTWSGNTGLVSAWVKG